MSKLSLDTLVVETFSPENAAPEPSYEARPSRFYTDCGSCGIACTSIGC
jgi:hypothetical protein